MMALSKYTIANYHLTVDSKWFLHAGTCIRRSSDRTAFLKICRVRGSTLNAAFSFLTCQHRQANGQNWRLTVKICVLRIGRRNTLPVEGVCRSPWLSCVSNFCVPYSIVAHCSASQPIRCVMSIMTVQVLYRSRWAFCWILHSPTLVLLVQWLKERV